MIHPFCRDLTTSILVEPFVDNILMIETESEKSKAIDLIISAEKTMIGFEELQTLDHKDNRDYRCRDDKTRNRLRVRILDELINFERLENDDEINLGKGGAAPKTKLKAEKIAVYLLGPPASGKSSISSKLADYIGAYILDSDYAKRKLPEFYSQLSGASLVHDESDNIIFNNPNRNLIGHCMTNGYNIVIPKVGTNEEKVFQLCSRLKKFGYSVYLISVDLDKVKATQRAYKRFVDTKRYIPLSLIFDGCGNEPALSYFRIQQKYSDVFSGFAQLSTDVQFGQPLILNEAKNMDTFKAFLEVIS